MCDARAEDWPQNAPVPFLSAAACLGRNPRLILVLRSRDDRHTSEGMKRIPRIKFPQRHPPKPTGSSPPADDITFLKSNVTSQPKVATSSGDTPSYRFRSDVPAPPSNTALGGKASLLPKRTPVSDKEIEAILLGGCF
ncbi:hypothetical protein OPV22_006620 [Ensete ventricosum]|uniref:Uncharacterized protein n=1 Tax=Ensete ventricosum TaxID=4639 RepID=A0AAV8RNG8_ENSVE|nr:hypothetical protein OPV22_006620 [Ensete ventricosum]